MKKILTLVILLLSSCAPATLLPTTSATLGEEFKLNPGQTAVLSDADLTVTLLGVSSDGRCPIDIECAASGPVAVELSIQYGSNAPNEISFITFTDTNGNTPELDFEGMTTRVEQDGYVVQIKSILPYPQRSANEIKEKDYQVKLIVTK